MMFGQSKHFGLRFHLPFIFAPYFDCRYLEYEMKRVSNYVWSKHFGLRFHLYFKLYYRPIPKQLNL